MTKLTGAALDRAVAHAMGLKSVHNCEQWGKTMDKDDDDTQVYKDCGDGKKAARPEQERSWVCNECGSSEFTSALSEADFEHLACAGCGCNEFHKEEKNT